MFRTNNAETFRLKNRRMPRIKTRAAAARQTGSFIGPEPRHVHKIQHKPQLRLIQGGKSEKSKGEKEFGKRKLCTNELSAQDQDELVRWRKGVAYALGHKNPYPTAPRVVVHEDMVRDMSVDFSFHYPKR